MTDRDLITEGRALLAAATPAPWDVADEIDGVRAGRPTVVKATKGDRRHRVVTVSQTRHHHEPAEPNVALIVWMRNNLPALLDELEEARNAYTQLHRDTQDGWARIAARQERDRERITELEQQAALDAMPASRDHDQAGEIEHLRARVAELERFETTRSMYDRVVDRAGELLKERDALSVRIAELLTQRRAAADTVQSLRARVAELEDKS